MRSRQTARIGCAGVLAAAVVAWFFGADVDLLSDDAYDLVVGGAAVAACACALVAAVPRSWARVPLAGVLVVAGLLAVARLGPPDDGIDLTGLYLPPVVLALGVIALMISLGEPAPRRQRS